MLTEYGRKLDCFCVICGGHGKPQSALLVVKKQVVKNDVMGPWAHKNKA